MGQHHGRLVLPGIRNNPDEKKDPAILCPPLLEEPSIESHLGDRAWGWLMGSETAIVQTAILRFFVRGADAEIVESGQAIAEAVEAWRDNLLQWVQALSGQDL
mgnify:FL=1